MASSNRPSRLQDVALGEIRPNPDQPRKTFDEDALRELAASVKRHGLIQPIVVAENDDDGFTIVAGERRFRAVRGLGWRTTSVLVIGDGMTDELALIENVQREDLHPLEEAEAMQGLMDRHQYTQRKLATVLGKARSTVTNTLKLNELPEVIKTECRTSKDVPKSVLLEIARLPEKTRLDVWAEVQEGRFTVQAARQKTGPRRKSAPKARADRGPLPRAVRAGTAFCNRLRDLPQEVSEEEVDQLFEIIHNAVEILEEMKTH
jgi:ParB family chromosome partitioning protein